MQCGWLLVGDAALAGGARPAVTRLNSTGTDTPNTCTTVGGCQGLTSAELVLAPLACLPLHD